MANVLSMRQSAEKIAADALARTTDQDANSATLTEALAAFFESAEYARDHLDGREILKVEREPERVDRLVVALLQGNWRETAAEIAGISSRSLRSWMESAESGETRYEPLARVVRVAEALAEASAVQNVRSAGKLPQFWAAEMTYLERKAPERWGRRNPEHNGPAVLVQIGIKDSEVQVQVSSIAPSASSTPLTLTE